MLLAQLDPVTHDVQANVATACRLLDEHSDVNLAVFPELFLQAYALKGLEPVDLDVDVDSSDVLEPLCATTRRTRTALLIGVAEDMGGAMANSALCIDERGTVAARYRKVHLFGAEDRFFVAGDGYVVVTLAGVAVGPLICYDLEFPEPARAVSAAGAELLVTLSANMDPYAEEHALFLRSRALENNRPHVYVNCVGQQGRLRFCGGSAVADAGGRLLAALPSYRHAVRIVDVPVGSEDPVPGALPDYLTDRRPDLPVRVARSHQLRD